MPRKECQSLLLLLPKSLGVGGGKRGQRAIITYSWYPSLPILLLGPDEEGSATLAMKVGS